MEDTANQIEAAETVKLSDSDSIDNCDNEWEMPRTNESENNSSQHTATLDTGDHEVPNGNGCDNNSNEDEDWCVFLDNR